MNIRNIDPTTDYPVSVRSVQSADIRTWQPCWHPDLEFILVTDGVLSVRVENQDLRLRAGQGLFLNQNVLHLLQQNIDTPFAFVLLRFLPNLIFGSPDGPLAEKYLTPVLSAQNLRYLVLDRECRDSADLLLLLKQMMVTAQSQAPGSELDVKAMLTRMWKYLALLAGKDRQSPEKRPSHSDSLRIKQAVKYIEVNYTHAITLDDIAATIHTSNSECCRCFKRSLGISPFEYLLKYRIYEAARLLRTEEAATETISDLAASVGFNSPSYFNKKFKQYLHCTPREYRQSYLKFRDRESILPKMPSMP